MGKLRNREEAVNTQLAVLLSRFGVKADAETIHVHGLHRPDVLFQLRGLRVVIEGKFADNPAADQIVLEDARRRVRSGIAHITASTLALLAPEVVFRKMNLYVMPMGITGNEARLGSLDFLSGSNVPVRSLPVSLNWIWVYWSKKRMTRYA